MESRGNQTKQAIIEAALPLFAEHGLEGVSVRTLSDAANVNVAAINYHFGSKDELYVEVVRYVFTDCAADLADDFSEQVDRAVEREELLDLLDQLIKAKTCAFLNDDKNNRFMRLLVLRVFLNDELALRVIGEFEVEHMAQIRLFQKLNPSFTHLQAGVAALSMTGQLAFYVFSRLPALRMLGIERYDETFRNEVSKMIYMNLTTPLNLPTKN